MTSKLAGEVPFKQQHAERILCYQLRNNIVGDRAWILSSNFEYTIEKGGTCCNGKGKLTISKVKVTKKTQKQ